MKGRHRSHSENASAAELDPIRMALFEGRYDEAFQMARTLRVERGPRVAPEILYAGACALFGLGHIHQAGEWVEEHGRLTMYRAWHLYLAAYLELHKDRPDRALLYWTRIVQADPSQTFADGLIEKIKRGEERVRQELAQSGSFLRYVPLDPLDPSRPDWRAPVRERRGLARLLDIPGWRRARDGGAASGEIRDSAGRRDSFWWLVAAIVFLSAFSIGVGAYLGEIALFFAPDPYSAIREDLPDVPLSGTVIPPEGFPDEAPRFLYASRDEALAEFREARLKIGDGLPNQARYLLGRLELSNASFEIKERARLLRDAIPRVSAADFRDPLDVPSVLQEPYIYRDAQVAWQGRVSNLRRSEAGLAFDLKAPTAPDATLIGVLYLYGPGSDRPPLPELADGQAALVFGQVVKAGGAQIQLQAEQIQAAQNL